MAAWLRHGNGSLQDWPGSGRSNLSQWELNENFLFFSWQAVNIFTRGQSWPTGIVVACVCPSVRPSVRHQVCPRNNSLPVEASFTKFWPKMQNTLVKVPIVFGGNRPWPSRSNLRSKSKFAPFWACPHHNSSPIQAGILNLTLLESLTQMSLKLYPNCFVQHYVSKTSWPSGAKILSPTRSRVPFSSHFQEANTPVQKSMVTARKT